MALFLLQSTDCNFRRYLHKKKTMEKVLRTVRGMFLSARTQCSYGRAPLHLHCPTAFRCVCCQDKFLLLTLGTVLWVHRVPVEVDHTQGFNLDCYFICHCLASGVLILSLNSSKFFLLPTATKSQHARNRLGFPHYLPAVLIKSSEYHKAV